MLGSGRRFLFTSTSSEATCFMRVLTCASTANIRTSKLGRNLVCGMVRSGLCRFWNPGTDSSVGTTTSTTANEFTLMDGNERPVESTYLFAWDFSPVPLDSQQGSIPAGAWMLEFAVLMTNDL